MKRTLALFRLCLQMLAARPGSGLIIVVGIAGLTAVSVSLFGLADAFEEALVSSGQPDRALVLRAGSTSEINGNVPLSQHRVVGDMPEVVAAARETYVTVNLPERHDGTDASLPMRGVTPVSFDVRPEVTLLEGRSFEPGRFELIAGVEAARLFDGIDLGASLQIRGQRWQVVGLFEAHGSVTETEIWVDERLLAESLGRGETFSSLLVRLSSASALEGFQARLAGDRRLTLSAQRETDYYAAQAESTGTLIRGLGWLVGVIMGLGALAAAFNTMQSALQTRSREIATLRALGFRRSSILMAVLLECVTLSLTGAAAAVAAVYMLLDGATLSTVAATTTSGAQLAFQFELDAQALMLAAGVAVGVGAIGGLLPGASAVRRSLTGALRGV